MKIGSENTNKLTPLEIAWENQSKICCDNCKNRVEIKGVNYCEVSGKAILAMHLNVNRNKQCKGENVKPILFNTEMVRAILDGRKTVTRRLIKPQPPKDGSLFYDGFMDLKLAPKEGNAIFKRKQLDGFCVWKPPYQLNDILYVRETFTQLYKADNNGYGNFDDVRTYYLADGIPDIDLVDADGFLLDDQSQSIKWKPSIHMPKKLARIFLKVTDVRVERLQGITDKDGLKEGFNAYIEFAKAWEDIYETKGYGWDTNPWVWVITFERMEGEHHERYKI